MECKEHLSFISTKDNSGNNHQYPSSDCENLSHTGGHIDTSEGKV